MLAALLGLAACKKDKDADNEGPGDNNTPAVTYTLRVSAGQGYFAGNPLNAVYDPDEAADFFMALYKPQAGGTYVRIRHTVNRVSDLLLYMDGGTGTGSKTIAYHPDYPESNLVLILPDGSFQLKLLFPEGTPLNITTYSGVNGVVEGRIQGTFTHQETATNPFSQTEYDAALTVDFKVKRSE